jgi:hypothetical protein
MIPLSKASFIVKPVRVRNAGPFVSPLLLSEYKTMRNFLAFRTWRKLQAVS